MPTRRDIETKLRELEDQDQNQDEDGESLADQWRRALGKSPDRGEQR